jgi:UDPglucose 6-dehydrogenase
MKTVAVVGLGYVGLTTSIGLAQLGHKVLGFDIDVSRISSLSAGESPIFEEGLEIALRTVLDSQNLTFADQIQEVADSKAEFIFVCVSTPQDESGAANLTVLNSVTSQLSVIAPPNSILVVKSTVPVGTGRRLAESIERQDVFMASNPEFLREGTAMRDVAEPDRIVVGANVPGVARRVLELYEEIDCPKVETTIETSELIKYAANAYLAMRLSFVNDIAALAEKTHANVDQVLQGMGMDKRIGSSFLKPGPGWGGSCFPKDTSALVSMANSAGASLPLVETAIVSNRAALDRAIQAILELAGGDLSNKVVAVWGVAFKAHTDDVRDSPALKVIEALLKHGALVQAYDPIALVPDQTGLSKSSSALQAATGADVLAILTEWPEFSEVSPEETTKLMKHSAVFDARRILPDSWRNYTSVFRVLGGLSK